MSYYLFSIQYERSTGKFLGGYQTQVDNYQKESSELYSHSFVYRKCFTDYHIDSKAFEKEVLFEMKRAILNDIPNEVIEMPVCPLEQMAEIETVDYC